jgi:predicted alpha/beta hydrolase family esterase
MNISSGTRVADYKEVPKAGQLAGTTVSRIPLSSSPFSWIVLESTNDKPKNISGATFGK